MARGTIFSDRDLYQPGETAQLTAVGWFLTHGVLGRGKAANYTVELQLPNQEKRKLPQITLNAYGTASIPIVIDKNAPLGYYNVHAGAGNGETIDGSFASLSSSRRTSASRSPLPATVAVAARASRRKRRARILRLTGRRRIDVLRNHAPAHQLHLGQRSGLRFRPPVVLAENQPSVTSDVLQQTIPVDASGNASLQVPVAADLPTDDVPRGRRHDRRCNLSVGDSKSFTAFPGSVQIGLKTDFVATAGTPAKISVIALDPHGTAVAQTKVHLELQLATYLSARPSSEGGDTPEQSVTIRRSRAPTSRAPRTRSSRTDAPDAGIYRIRATIAGASNDAMETDVQIYVSGTVRRVVRARSERARRSAEQNHL